METGYYLAFATGLLGGFGHCLGMCGPLVAAHSFRKEGDAYRETFVRQILYNTGRITTYVLGGGIMGLAGSFADVAARILGLQNGVMIGAGLFMIFMGLSIMQVLPGTAWIEGRNSLILGIARRFIPGSSAWRFFPLGLVLGLLPCGLSYTELVAAAGTADPGAGMATMLFFGLGTLPGLLLFSVLISSVTSRLRGWLYRAGGGVVVIMGMLFLLKGIRAYAPM